MNERQNIPLTVIGGYLGAGKTTLLNHILRHNKARRLAIIVNDFGSISIDVELIESQDGNTINLASGCICCTMVDGFAAALINIGRLPSPPDHITVEASCVADPHKLGQWAGMPGFRLDGVIVLADAELVRQKARDKYVVDTVSRQLQGADVIILNRTDLVTPETLKDVRAWLQGLVPDVHIVEAIHGAVPLPLLLGDQDRPDRSPKSVESYEHNHNLDYDTWSYTASEPFDGQAFRGLVAALPDGVIRAKGILYLTEAPISGTLSNWSASAGA
jgi:G3E family GTPase